MAIATLSSATAQLIISGVRRDDGATLRTGAGLGYSTLVTVTPCAQGGRKSPPAVFLAWDNAGVARVGPPGATYNWGAG